MWITMNMRIRFPSLLISTSSPSVPMLSYVFFLAIHQVFRWLSNTRAELPRHITLIAKPSYQDIICVVGLGQHWLRQKLVACLGPNTWANVDVLSLGFSWYDLSEISNKRTTHAKYAFVNVVCETPTILLSSWCYNGDVCDIHLLHRNHDTLLPNMSSMMTSSNGNIFRATGHLCGEFTGPGEFPIQRPVTRSFDFSLICVWINGWVSNREAGDLRLHRGHSDVIVMTSGAKFVIMTSIM